MAKSYGVSILIEVLRNLNKKNQKKKTVKFLRYYIRSRKGSVKVPNLEKIVEESIAIPNENADDFYDRVFERIDKGR